MNRVIDVIVSPTGEATVQTRGFAGSDCLQASKFIEQALGLAANDRKTPEFFQVDQNRQHVNQ
jgi:Protein of unknown function (DUF2997)